MSNWKQLSLSEFKNELLSIDFSEKEIERLLDGLPQENTGGISFSLFFAEEGYLMGFNMTKWVPYHFDPSN